MTYAYIKKLDEGRVNVTVLEEPHDKKMWHGDRTILTPTPSREFSEDNLLTEEDLTNGYYYIEIDEDNCLVERSLGKVKKAKPKKRHLFDKPVTFSDEIPQAWQDRALTYTFDVLEEITTWRERAAWEERSRKSDQEAIAKKERARRLNSHESSRQRSMQATRLSIPIPSFHYQTRCSGKSLTAMPAPSRER